MCQVDRQERVWQHLLPEFLELTFDSFARIYLRFYSQFDRVLKIDFS